MNKKAALVKGPDRKENIKRCLALIQSDLGPIKKAKNILIKPNLSDNKPGCANTSVEAVEAVIEFVRGVAPKTPIIVGESSATAFYRGQPTTKVFEDCGYYGLEKRYSNVSLTDFDEDKEFVKSPVLSVVGSTHLRITKRGLGFDYKISLATPKMHNYAIATLGIKNMAGLILRQDMAMIHGMKGGVEVDAPKTLLDRLPKGSVYLARRIFPGLVNYLFRQYPVYRRSVKMIHRNIAVFAKKVWPDLVVLDGFFCMEGNGPVNGIPVKMGVAVASADAIKADGIGARLMGFEPEDIGYLFYLSKMGDYSLKNLVGDDLNKVKRKLKRHDTYDIQKEWKV